MANLSDYAENLVYTWLLTGLPATRPTAWFIGLYTAAPSDAGGGTEVSGGGYARQAVTFSAPSGGTGSNTAALAFPATASWGLITHLGIFDAATGGNLIEHAPLADPRTIGAGETLPFAIGEIVTSFA